MCFALDPLLRRRRISTPAGLPAALQVMSPNGPSALTAPGPQQVGGEHVERHQDLIPAVHGSGTVNSEWQFLTWKGRACVANVGGQSGISSGLAQAPSQGVGLDLVPTWVGGGSSPGRTHPFTIALREYGSTEPFRPVQTEVSTSTTVVEQTQAVLRRGFRWLGEIVHRTIGMEYQIDPCWFHHVAIKDVPTRSGSVDWERSGTHNPKSKVLDAPFFVKRTPAGRYGTVVPAGATASVLRRLHQASPPLQGPPQAQEEQVSSWNTPNIQEVSDFMSQQAQAMHRLQSENEALRERLQVRQSPPHERLQLVDQPPQPTLKLAMPRFVGVPTSFHPSRERCSTGASEGRDACRTGRLQCSNSPKSRRPAPCMFLCMFFGKRDTSCSRPCLHVGMVFRISRCVAESARPRSTSQRIAQQRPMMQERGKERVRTVRGIRPRIKTPTRTTRTRKAPLPTRTS